MKDDEGAMSTCLVGVGVWFTELFLFCLKIA